MRKTSPHEGGAPADPQEAARNALLKAASPKPVPAGPKPRRLPIRTCVACRTSRPKRDLVRVVRTTEGEVRLDSTGRMNGRGAYLCPKADCLRSAVKRRALGRALGAEPPPESIAALEGEMENLPAPPSEPT